MSNDQSKPSATLPCWNQPDCKQPSAPGKRYCIHCDPDCSVPAHQSKPKGSDKYSAPRSQVAQLEEYSAKPKKHARCPVCERVLQQCMCNLTNQSKQDRGTVDADAPFSKAEGVEKIAHRAAREINASYISGNEQEGITEFWHSSGIFVERIILRHFRQLVKERDLWKKISDGFSTALMKAERERDAAKKLLDRYAYSVYHGKESADEFHSDVGLCLLEIGGYEKEAKNDKV